MYLYAFIVIDRILGEGWGGKEVVCEVRKGAWVDRACKPKQSFIRKNIKSSTQNSNELIHGHYFYLSDIVANGYFFQTV